MAQTRRRSHAARSAPDRASAASAEPKDGSLPGEGWLLAAILGCVLARALASLSDSSWLWGANTFRDWSSPWPVLLPALAVAAFVPLFARLARGPLTRAGEALSRSSVAVPALVGVLAGAVLFLVTDALRFTGDSGSRAALIPAAVVLPAMLPQIAPLDLLVGVEGVRAFMRAGLPAAAAMQLVPALLGALLAAALLAFVRATGARGAMAWAAAILVLSSGAFVHFPGYGKYGVLLVGLAIGAIGLARLARTGGGEVWLAIGAAIAVLGHRSGYAVVPAALWALAVAWRLAPPPRRARVALWAAALVAVAGAMLPRTIGVFTHYDLANNVVGLGPARPANALRQLADLANAISFSSPLWPAGLVAALLAWRPSRTRPGSPAEAPGERPAAVAAALAVAGLLGVGLASRPVQGPARDWDVFTGAGLAVTLASAGALVALARERSPVRASLALGVAAAVMGASLWGVQFGAGIRERRLRTVLADSTGWTSAERARAHEYLGTRAFQAERYDEAARWYETVAELAPSARMLDNLAASQAMAGRAGDAARTLRRAMAMPQSSTGMWMALVQVAWTIGDTARAVECADSALAHEPGRADALAIRAQLLRAAGHTR